MKNIIKLSSMLLILINCSNSTKKKHETGDTQKSNLNKETQRHIKEIEIENSFKLNDSMLYVTDKIPNIRALIKMELITKKEFEAIPENENNLIEKFNDRFVSIGDNSYDFELKNGELKAFTPNSDYYYSLSYYGHIDIMGLFFLYVSDDDSEAPYRLFSSISGNLLYSLRQYPSFSPKGNYIVYADDTVMGNGNLMILKMTERGKLEKIIDNSFANWERGAKSEADYKIKWINHNTFSFEIVSRGIDIQEEDIEYLKIEIL